MNVSHGRWLYFVASVQTQKAKGLNPSRPKLGRQHIKKEWTITLNIYFPIYYLSVVDSSLRIFFLSLVKSPWARNALTIPAYASSSVRLNNLLHSSLLMSSSFGHILNDDGMIFYKKQRNYKLFPQDNTVKGTRCLGLEELVCKKRLI